MSTSVLCYILDVFLKCPLVKHSCLHFKVGFLFLFSWLPLLMCLPLPLQVNLSPPSWIKLLIFVSYYTPFPSSLPSTTYILVTSHGLNFLLGSQYSSPPQFLCSFLMNSTCLWWMIHHPRFSVPWTPYLHSSATQSHGHILDLISSRNCTCIWSLYL